MPKYLTFDDAARSNISTPVFVLRISGLSVENWAAVDTSLVNATTQTVPVSGFCNGRIKKFGTVVNQMPGAGAEQTDFLPRASMQIELVSTPSPFSFAAADQDLNYFGEESNPFDGKTVKGRTATVYAGFEELDLSLWRPVFTGVVDDVRFDKQNCILIVKDLKSEQLETPANWPTWQDYVDAGAASLVFSGQESTGRPQVVVGILLNSDVTDRGRVNLQPFGAKFSISGFSGGSIDTVGGARYGGSAALLATVPVASITADEQRYTQADRVLYKWNDTSTQAADGISIVIPSTLPPSGRWEIDGFQSPIAQLPSLVTLKLIPFAGLVNGDRRVVTGPLSVWTWDAGSFLYANDIDVALPADSTSENAGRWIRGSNNGVDVLPLSFVLSAGGVESLVNLYAIVGDEKRYLRPSIDYVVVFVPAGFTFANGGVNPGVPLTCVVFRDPSTGMAAPLGESGTGYFYPSANDQAFQAEVRGVHAIASAAGIGLPAETNPIRLAAMLAQDLSAYAAGPDPLSYADAVAEADRRGYSAAGLVSGSETPKAAIGSILQSFGAMAFSAENGLVGYSLLAPYKCWGEIEPVVSDQLDILDGSYQVLPEVSKLVNQMNVEYGKNKAIRSQPGKPSDHGNTQILTRPDSIALYGGLPVKTVTLNFVEDDRTASDVVMRMLKMLGRARGRSAFKTSLRALADAKLNDIVLLTHFAGMRDGGFYRVPHHVQKFSIDCDKYSAGIEAVDGEDMYTDVYILGDEITLAGNWGVAPDADRCYGYLCDEATEKFSDGDGGKRLY